MRIFMTGTTGYIGSAVARRVREQGHTVVAAAHSDAMMHHLAARGYTPVAADLSQPETLAAHAAAADAVIHLGFAAGPDAAEVDRRAAESLLTALDGSGRPVIYTSGVWVLGPTGDAVADERSPLAPIAAVAWRGPLERWLQDAATRGAHPVIVRPGIVHGDGGGIPGKTVAGILPVVGSGEQRWPVVHLDDLAGLYVAALERAAPGTVLHGVTEVVTVRALVGSGPLVRHEALERARTSLGDFAEALATDQVVSSALTQAAVGWTPTRFVGGESRP